MKRVLPVMFLGVLIVVVALIIAAPLLFNSPRRKALSAYLNYYNAVNHGTQVLSLVQAGRPMSFTAAMSGRVVGDGAFRTDLSFAGQTRSTDGLRPLPYPPADLSCALLSTANGNAVIFIALHQDAANAEWLVHEAKAPWPGEQVRSDLAAVGCSFVVDP
ncbi:MAG: hypothetical protein M1434_07805 [Chloroflexi bacterium]|nr:hypothetical protein [Chloroflexota bacterium]MCL5274634.1 hypothetical protein [Chloroflexota bacterium]